MSASTAVVPLELATDSLMANVPGAGNGCVLEVLASRAAVPSPKSQVYESVPPVVAMKLTAVKVNVVTPAMPVPDGDCAMVPVVVAGPVGAGGGLLLLHAGNVTSAKRKTVRTICMLGIVCDRNTHRASKPVKGLFTRAQVRRSIRPERRTVLRAEQ